MANSIEQVFRAAEEYEFFFDRGRFCAEKGRIIET